MRRVTLDRCRWNGKIAAWPANTERRRRRSLSVNSISNRRGARSTRRLPMSEDRAGFFLAKRWLELRMGAESRWSGGPTAFAPFDFWQNFSRMASVLVGRPFQAVSAMQYGRDGLERPCYFRRLKCCDFGNFRGPAG